MTDKWWFQAAGTKLEEIELAVLEVAMPIDRKEWRKTQLTDEYRQKVKEDIQKDDDLSLSLRGDLYRRYVDPNLYDNEEPIEQWHVVITQSLMSAVLEQYHDKPRAGHDGVQKTFE